MKPEIQTEAEAIAFALISGAADFSTEIAYVWDSQTREVRHE